MCDCLVRVNSSLRQSSMRLSLEDKLENVCMNEVARTIQILGKTPRRITPEQQCYDYAYSQCYEAKAVMISHVLFLSILTLLVHLVYGANYQEHLLLRPLPQSSLLAAFDFKSNITLSDFEAQNYNVFPRSLGQILRHAHTKELHLRFSLGRWDAENWGARPRGGRREGGTGVELWAWVEAETDQEYEDHKDKIRSELLTCR